MKYTVSSTNLAGRKAQYLPPFTESMSVDLNPLCESFQDKEEFGGEGDININDMVDNL